MQPTPIVFVQPSVVAKTKRFSFQQVSVSALILAAVCTLFFVFFLFLNNKPVPPTPPPASLPFINITIIDCGQGDAILISGPDFCILYDTGRWQASDIVPYLSSQNITSLDLLVGSHVHADHIGQHTNVLNALKVNEVWMPGTSTTTQTFLRTLRSILISGTKYREPRAGQVYAFANNLILHVLNPPSLNENIHPACIVIKVVWGDFSIILTGDVETVTESAIVNRGYDLKSTVLKLSHHGSSTSTSESFLRAVDPELAVYSASSTNQYGHPHSVVIDRLRSYNVSVFGTNIHGHVKITTNGQSFSVATQKSAPPL
ncbi:hypothetical protein RCL1_001858 [Eukaryota sp. TZLM3-RCL]